MADGLVEHLERSLGPIARGWAEDGDGRRLPFSIVRFKDAPTAGITTYATLGLSRHVLKLPTKSVRQELLLAVRDGSAEPALIGALLAVGAQLVSDHRALVRGEVVPPRDVFAPGSRLSALYTASPVVFAEELAVSEATDPPTIVVWLIPVSGEEAALIGSHGWSWFEDQLEAQSPDLFDLMRDPIRH